MELLMTGDMYAETADKKKPDCIFLVRRGLAVPIYQLEIYSQKGSLLYRKPCQGAAALASGLLEIDTVRRVIIKGDYIEQDINSKTYFDRTGWGFLIRTAKREDQYVINIYRPQSDIPIATEYCNYREAAIRKLLSYQDH